MADKARRKPSTPRIRASAAPESGKTARGMMDFESLVSAIAQAHERLAARARKAINVCLTLRNWIIGRYIHEYEMRGSDRAAYGSGLFDALAHKLKERGVSNSHRRELYRYRDFYTAYPEIVGTLFPQFQGLLPHEWAGTAKVGTPRPQSGFAAEELLNRLSYSHFEQLTAIGDPLQRAFYEAECIRGNWSVRELKRQIATLYYERSGLSKDKKKLAAIVRSKAEPASSAHVIRDPYVFEFLGLKPREVMSESALEDQLLDRLQDFLLELGRGFCFEARQKRILIGGEHFFVDLVFYHRILKCHVLIELKVDAFAHEYLGQLNTYVTWFRAHEMADGDNPPIGILLCTRKNHALAEYALAGLDNRLFVSKYQLELPRKEEIRRFLEEQIQAERRPGTKPR